MNFVTGKREARFVTANKELVEALLALNTRNRRDKRTAIEYYKKDMENCTWFATNQGIGVSKTGVLIDGQNRLIAMRELEYPPVEFLLVTGLDDAAQAHVDTHSRRTQADLLRLMLNQKASNLAIAAINARQLFKTNNTNDRLTIDEVASELAHWHEIVSALLTSLRSIRKAAIVAALMDYAEFTCPERAVVFAEKIGAGENLQRSDPAYKIREYAMKSQPPGAGGTLRMYRLMVSACVADFKKSPLSILKETETWPRLKSEPRTRAPRIPESRTAPLV